MCIKRYIVVDMDGVTGTKLVVKFEWAYIMKSQLDNSGANWFVW